MIVRAWTRWIRFLFGSVSILPLVALRIATGALTLIWSVMLYADLDPLLTYLRVEPDQSILWWQFLPNLSLAGLRVLCVGLIVMSFLLTVGAWSRLSAWAVFLLTLILQRYNPSAFNGGDFILRSVLQLGVALGPAGGYLSVDAARKKVASKPIPQIEAWPIRFVQLHVSVGYLLTFYLKTQGHTWFDGTALWYALNLEDLTRFNVPDLLIQPPLGTILTWLAVGVEALVGVGVWWRRTRAVALLAGIALHIGIAIAFQIGFFSLVMITSYLAFIPGSTIETFWNRIRRGARVTELRSLELRETAS